MHNPITRRFVLAASAASLAAARSRAAPAGFPPEPTILVAGPAGGHTDRWACGISCDRWKKSPSRCGYGEADRRQDDPPLLKIDLTLGAILLHSDCLLEEG